MSDPIADIAGAVASLCGEIGFAFVEDEHLAALALVLRDFFRENGIGTHDDRAIDYYRNEVGVKLGCPHDRAAVGSP